MKTEERLVQQVEGIEEIEFVEMGEASKDTRGTNFGGTWDNLGFKSP